MILVVLEEGRLEGGTRTLIGGFDTVAIGWSPEVDGLEVREGRRMDPTGFLIAFETAVVDLFPESSDVESENRPGHLFTEPTWR